MKATKKLPFNVKKFLTSVNGGRTLSTYGKINLSSRRETRQIPSFTFGRERSRSASVPTKARKRSSPSMGREIFLARAV